jgi:hypothetical protein
MCIIALFILLVSNGLVVILGVFPLKLLKRYNIRKSHLDYFFGGVSFRE